MRIGLDGVAHYGAVDDERGLLFLGDSKRIKAYSWWDSKRNHSRERFPHAHTMNSKGFEDPMALLPNGRLVRAGKGKIAIWTLDRLPDHRRESGRLFRRLSGLFRSEREDDGDGDETEECGSPGVKPHSILQLKSDPDFEVGSWHNHPSAAGKMLVAGDVYEGYARYDCRAMDLEQGGKSVMRFLGHGGAINAFSTSGGDLNVFVTAAEDGYARVYDVRSPLSVLTIQASLRDNPWVNCTSAVVCHPDGIPCTFNPSIRPTCFDPLIKCFFSAFVDIFASDKTSECITLWDVRAKKAVYDLATGNNQVVGMVWNDKRNELWASTSCPYIEPNGAHPGYSKSASRRGRGWPREAYHDEKYFGHVFDSGDHQMCAYLCFSSLSVILMGFISAVRYAFKSEPNLEIVPSDGRVRPSEGYAADQALFASLLSA